MQSQVWFNRVPEKVPDKVGEVLVQSQVRFNRVPEKVPEKVWEALVPGGCGAEAGQVQLGKVLWLRSGRLLCRRRVKFNEVLETVPKVPEKVWLWCRARSGSTAFWRMEGSGEGSVRLWYRAGQVQQGSG